MIALGPWNDVSPQSYLQAAQAGASLGLNLAELRQRAQDQAAERAARASALSSQLQQQRELKLAELSADERMQAHKDSMEEAGLRLSESRLNLQQAAQDFEERQAKAKLDFQAKTLEQRAGFLRRVGEGVKPLKAAEEFPLALPDPTLTSLLAREQADTEVRSEIRSEGGRQYVVFTGPGNNSRIFDISEKSPEDRMQIQNALSSKRQAELALGDPLKRAGKSQYEKIISQANAVLKKFGIDYEAGDGETQGEAAALPEVGEVRRGYRYKGGDPSKPSSWEKL